MNLKSIYYSLRTNACVSFSPEVIATSCIYLAARCLQIPLPERPKPWWELFDTTWNDIVVIGRLVMELFNKPPAHHIAVKNPKYKNDTFEEETIEDTPPRNDTNGDKTPPRRREANIKEDDKHKDKEKEKGRERDHKRRRDDSKSSKERDGKEKDRRERKDSREKDRDKRGSRERDRSKRERGSGHYSPQRSRHSDRDRRRSPY